MASRLWILNTHDDGYYRFHEAEVEIKIAANWISATSIETGDISYWPSNQVIALDLVTPDKVSVTMDDPAIQADLEAAINDPDIWTVEDL